MVTFIGNQNQTQIFTNRLIFVKKEIKLSQVLQRELKGKVLLRVAKEIGVSVSILHDWYSSSRDDKKGWGVFFELGARRLKDQNSPGFMGGLGCTSYRLLNFVTVYVAAHKDSIKRSLRIDLSSDLFYHFWFPDLIIVVSAVS